VADAVIEAFLRAERTESLRDQPATRPEIKSGRVGGPLYPEGLARCGQGVQLAAGPSRQVRVDAADVLAKREEPLDPQWVVDDPSGEEGQLTDEVEARHNGFAAGRRGSSSLASPSVTTQPLITATMSTKRAIFA
jgi:hypothetical protein